MTKRSPSDSDGGSESSFSSQHNESDNENQSDVDVEFEFKEPGEIDFHGLKSLLAELLKTDQQINISNLANSLIENPLTTVVKAEGNLDPFAVISLIDAQDKKYLEIVEYLKSLSPIQSFQDIWKSKVGIVINTRLLNMPPQIVPPMFNLMLNDSKLSLDYYVFLSKAYLTVEKRKKKQKADKKEYFYFQVEDEFIEQKSIITIDYELKNQQSSGSRRVFNDHGIEQSRRLFVVESKEISGLKKILDQNLIE